MNRLFLFALFGILTINVMAQKKTVQTAGRDQLGEFAPKFAQLNDDVPTSSVSATAVSSPLHLLSVRV